MQFDLSFSHFLGDEDLDYDFHQNKEFRIFWFSRNRFHVVIHMSDLETIDSQTSSRRHKK